MSSYVLLAVIVSQSFLVFEDLDSFVVLVRYFVEKPLMGIWLTVISWLDGVMGLWEEDQTSLYI